MKQKNSRTYYVLIWILFIIVFNAVIYLFNKNIITDCYDYIPVIFEDGTNGIKAVFKSTFVYLLKGYIAIMVSFALQIVFSLIYISKETMKKDLYNYSIFGICIQGLVVTFIASLIYAYNKFAPIACIIIFSIITIITIIRIVFSNVATTIVTAGDENQKKKLLFVEILRSKSLSLMEYATTDDEKSNVKKIIEAIKFSDPVSISDLYDIENLLIEKYEYIVETLKNHKKEEFDNNTKEFLITLKERNNDVKRLK